MAFTESGVEFKVKKGILVPNNATFQDGVLHFPDLQNNTTLEDNTFVTIELNDDDKALKTFDPITTLQLAPTNYALISSGSNDSIINPDRLYIGQYVHPFGYASALTGSIVYNDGALSGYNISYIDNDAGNTILTDVSSSKLPNGTTKRLFTINTSYYYGLVLEYVVHNFSRTKTKIGTYQAILGVGGADYQFTNLTTTGLSTMNFTLAINTGVSPVAFEATNNSGENMYITFEKTVFGGEVAY